MGESFEKLLVNLAPPGSYPSDKGDDVYALSIREWVAHQIRGRGHKHTRDDVRNAKFAIGTGFHGTEVTPADEPYEAIVCEVRSPGGSRWHEHEESLEWTSPAQLVCECHAICASLARKAVAPA